MGDVTFSGDLEGVSEVQLEIIKKVLVDRGFVNKEVKIERVGKAGDNYVANVKRVIVEDGAFKMIAKVAPTNPMVRMASNIPSMFKNEHIMYTKILPKFNQMLESADVPKEERLRYAECYSTCLDDMNELILLEDLVEAGYSVLDRFQPLNNEQVKSVLRNFALLHSLSYALKEKDPSLYDEAEGNLFDMWLVEIPEQVMFFEMYFKQIEASISTVLREEDHKRLIKSVFSDGLHAARKLLKSEKGTKQVVIQQGDAWTNNLMFKDNSPIPDSIMIDYQQSKSGSPVLDLVYFLFNCTDYQTRRDHFNDWLDFYHTELDKGLSNFGLKANFLYPRDKLDADLKRYAKMGLTLAVMLTMILIAKPEDAQRIQDSLASEDKEDLLKNASFTSYGADTMSKFCEKIEGVINSFIELGLISV